MESLRTDPLVPLAMVVGVVAEDEQPEASDRAMEAFRTLMRPRRGRRDGWLRFCEQLGVNPDAMTAPFLTNVEWAMDAAERVAEILDEDGVDQPDDTETIATREFEALTDAWGDAA